MESKKMITGVIANNVSIDLEVVENELMIDSLMVSRIFGTGSKYDHKNTMAKIKELIELDVVGFHHMSYRDGYNRKQKMYTMDLVAFTMLANRYTVPRAIEYQLVIAKAFRDATLVPKLPQTKIEALEALIVSEKKILEVESKNFALIEVNEKQSEIIVKQEKEIKEVKVKYLRHARMVEVIMRSDNLYTATQVGQDVGVSGILFNRIMVSAEIIRPMNGIYSLRSDYTHTNIPLAVTHEVDAKHKEGTVPAFAWTSKGKEWVYNNWDRALSRMDDEVRESYNKHINKQEKVRIPRKRQKKIHFDTNT